MLGAKPKLDCCGAVPAAPERCVARRSRRVNRFGGERHARNHAAHNRVTATTGARIDQTMDSIRRVPVGRDPGIDSRAGARGDLYGDGLGLVGFRNDRRHRHQCERADHRGVVSRDRSPDEVSDPGAARPRTLLSTARHVLNSVDEGGRRLRQAHAWGGRLSRPGRWRHRVVNCEVDRSDVCWGSVSGNVGVGDHALRRYADEQFTRHSVASAELLGSVDAHVARADVGRESD
jgi:hypothetical protein